MVSIDCCWIVAVFAMRLKIFARDYPVRVALLIASSLRKEFGADVLFDDVSFKVERRDRVALVRAERRRQDDAAAGDRGRDRAAGRRARVREGRADRAPRPAAAARPQADAARVRPLRRRRPRRARGGAAPARAGDGRRRPRRARRSAATPGVQARLEHAGGYDWRDRAGAVVRGLGFADADLDRPLQTFSGGELTRASLARALAGDPDLLLLDEPTNHLDVESLEWLERELASLDAGVILVAHDRWFLEAVTNAVLELDGRPLDLLPRALARVAAREGGARARTRRKTVDRYDGRHRAARPLRRALPLQEVEGEAGAGEADADRAAREGPSGGRRRAREADREAALARLRVPEAAADRAHRGRGEGPRPRGRRQAAAPRRLVRDRARRARRARRPERLGQDDAARDDPRHAAAEGRSGPARARRRSRRTSHSTRSSSTSAAACSSARRARPACRGRRRSSCSAGSSSPAGMSTRSR